MKPAPKLYLAAALILTMGLTACSNQEEDKAPATTTQIEKSAPVSAPPAPTSAPSTIEGSVVETFNSGGYTYIKLNQNGQETWAAISETAVTVGDQISILPGPVMHDFHSRSLDRTFPEIIFSSGLNNGHGGSPHGSMTASPHGGGEESSFSDALKAEGVPMVAPTAPMGGMGGGAASQVSGGSLQAVTSLQDIVVAKASGENSYTVEDIFTKSADLAGKTVRIQGQAIKVSPRIMGKNWIHLQDGTGNPLNNSHDLVITSNDLPAKGDIILIEGTVTKDKDFGAGYKYDVIIEDATISQAATAKTDTEEEAAAKPAKKKKAAIEGC